LGVSLNGTGGKSWDRQNREHQSLDLTGTASMKNQIFYLKLEAASYLATDIIKSLCSKIMENSRYSEYIFILVDFLGRTIPDYVFETSKLSGYLIDPQDRPNIKFSSFVSSKKITNDVIKPIMGVRKKLPTHKTNSIKSKELDEKLRKLREATLVRPLLTSKVFRIFQEHQ